jgi:transposase
MAAPLSDCTIEEQRAVVRFMWAELVKSAEVHRRMLAQYGARTMHQRKICGWIEHFKEGRTSVMDESRPGRPSISRMDQHIQRVDALIREDRRLTLARVADIVGISYGSAQATVHDDLGYHKVCAR